MTINNAEAIKISITIFKDIASVRQIQTVRENEIIFDGSNLIWLDGIDETYNDASLRAIKRLSVINMHMSRIPFNLGKYFKGLRTLEIVNSELKVLAEGDLISMPRLQVLDLHDNKLEELVGRVFENTPSIYSVILTGNKLKIIDGFLFWDLYSVNTIKISRQVDNDCYEGVEYKSNINLSNFIRNVTILSKTCEGEMFTRRNDIQRIDFSINILKTLKCDETSLENGELEQNNLKIFELRKITFIELFIILTLLFLFVLMVIYTWRSKKSVPQNTLPNTYKRNRFRFSMSDTELKHMAHVQKPINQTSFLPPPPPPLSLTENNFLFE